MRPLLGFAAALVLVALAAAPAPARAAPFYLYVTVELSGNGSGRFITTLEDRKTPDGMLDCRIVKGYVDPREVCSQQFDGGDDHQIRIYIAMLPDTGSCIGPATDGCYSSYTEIVDLKADRSFSYSLQLRPFNVFATKTGTGTGTIVSVSAITGIDCGFFCAGTWLYGDAVTLVATPAAGSHFAGWTGTCAGHDSTCELTVTTELHENAIFTLGNAPTPGSTAGATPGATPRVTPRPTASGSPTSSGAAPSTTVVGSAAPSAPIGSSVPAATTIAGQSASAPTPAPSLEPAAADADPNATLRTLFGAGLVIAAVVLVGLVLQLRTPRASKPS